MIQLSLPNFSNCFAYLLFGSSTAVFVAGAAQGPSREIDLEGPLLQSVPIPNSLILPAAAGLIHLLRPAYVLLHAKSSFGTS